jgi:hypothetical protein
MSERGAVGAPDRSRWRRVLSSFDYGYRMKVGEAVLPRSRIK